MTLPVSFRLALSLATALSGLPVLAHAEAVQPRLRVELKPELAGDVMGDVGVKLTLIQPDAAQGDVLVSLPLVRVMAPSGLQDGSTLTARDEAGDLPLALEVDAVDPSNFLQDRRWRAGRATQGPVVVEYRVAPRQITPQTRPGPLYDMRAEGRGFHSSGGMMIALPPQDWPRELQLDWDLSGLPDGARAASSLGLGDVTRTVSSGNIESSFFMAGPVLSLPESGEGDFVGYWLTPAVFDLDGALGKIERAYGEFSRFFGKEAEPFKVFMRTTDRFAGGGSGGYQSFMFGTVEGEVRQEAELLNLLAHETLHNWLKGFEGSDTQWWSEGSTNYYTEVLSYRSGLSNLEQFQKNMNRLVRDYSLNPRSHLPAAEVTQLFFSDGDAQLVPYQRGPVYFAQLDARLRAATAQGLRVDDLVREFVALEASHKSEKAWIDLLQNALGEGGVANFQAMMAGEPLDLPADMLGRCFVRQDVVLNRFIPGFRVEPNGTVTRVLPGGVGAAAGVKDGDRLVDPLALKFLETAGRAEATLDIVRGDRPLTINFMPWGPDTPAYQWARTEVAEADCDI